MPCTASASGSDLLSIVSSLFSRLLLLIPTIANGAWSLLEFIYRQLFGALALVQGFSGT